jgi:probable addiction module antidote protein
MTKRANKTTAKTKTLAWDTADHLKTADDIAAYLEAAFEDGDPELVSHALGAVARSQGMTEIARRTGLGRQSLYKALSPEGRPEFTTVFKVVKALGLSLTVSGGRGAMVRNARTGAGKMGAVARAATVRRAAKTRRAG